jgi:hypothetical protein
MNVGSLDWRTTLGFKGYVCNKCFHFWCKQIFDDEEGISLKSNHTCDPQKLHEAHRYTDIAETMHKKRQQLISLITCAFNKQQELLDLTAVEIPSSVFNNRSDSYEEYVDLDTLPFGTPYWAYDALKEGKTVINRTDLAEFLDIFEATLGFLRLTIGGVKHYFFVYIAKGLEPRDIKYLKKFLDADSPITTGISIAIGNSVINKIRVDIRLNKFSSFETVPLIKHQSYLSQFLTSLGYAENPVLRLVSILEKEEKKKIGLRFFFSSILG